MPLFKKKNEPWMLDYKKHNKQYASPDFSQNLLLSKHVRLSLDDTKERNNKHVCVFGDDNDIEQYILSNLLQASHNYIVPDDGGYLYAMTGEYLRKRGYTVQAFDVADAANTVCYNPLLCIQPDDDVALMEMASQLLHKDSVHQFRQKDHYLVFAALHYVCTLPVEQRTFGNVYTLLQKALDEHKISAVAEVLHCDEDIARSRAYECWCESGAKAEQMETLQQIVTALGMFQWDALKLHTSTDNLNLSSCHEGKRAIFITCHVGTETICQMLYWQLLHYLAQTARNGTFVRPWLVFCNQTVPSLYYLLLGRQQPYAISLMYSSLALLKKEYPENWDSIVGVCDNLLYLGGKSLCTVEYLSKELGYLAPATNYRKLKRMYKNPSINYLEIRRRALMTPYEITCLPINQCILKMRGVKPILDEKYVAQLHPNAAQMGQHAKE